MFAMLPLTLIIIKHDHASALTMVILSLRSNTGGSGLGEGGVHRSVVGENVINLSVVGSQLIF